MIDPKVLGKIKKCLALSSSDNPHEAAAAMRQAHALMAAHGVSAEQITMADIGEAHASSRTMARNKPALKRTRKVFPWHKTKSFSMTAFSSST